MLHISDYIDTFFADAPIRFTQPPADYLFRMTHGSRIVRGINVGGINEVSPTLDEPIHNAMRDVVVGLPRPSFRPRRSVAAESHRSQAEGRNTDARRTEISIF